jgi:hypothetical protein
MRACLRLGRCGRQVPDALIRLCRQFVAQIRAMPCSGSVPSDREPPAAVWRSGRPNLREVPGEREPPLKPRHPTSRKMSASSPIEKPMVASNSPMAMNDTASPWRARGDRSCSQARRQCFGLRTNIFLAGSQHVGTHARGPYINKLPSPLPGQPRRRRKQGQGR